MSKSKKKSTNKKIWRAIFVVLVAACVFCIAVLLIHLYRESGTQEQYESIAEQVKEPESIFQETIPEPVPEKASLPVDFNSLWEINPEIYAWLYIPDTKVDYPILQHGNEDQSYYLTHDMYGETSSAASIYTEYYNRKNFEDPNTLIYGHNMKNGSMFHDLRYFAQKDFFEEHEDLYIYTPDSILRYKIFASYEYDDRHLLAAYDFEDEEIFADYLKEIMNPRSMYTMLRADCALDTDSRIVTLSTCVANKPQSRRLVQAVLVEELEAEYKGESDAESSEEIEKT